MLVPAPAPNLDTRRALRIAGVLGFVISVTFWLSDYFGAYEMMWTIRGWLLMVMVSFLYQAWAFRHFQADPITLNRRLKSFANEMRAKLGEPIVLHLADPVWWRGYQIVWQGDNAFVSPRAVAELDDDEFRWLLYSGRAINVLGFSRESMGVTVGGCALALCYMIWAVLSSPLDVSPWLNSLGVWSVTLLVVHIWQRRRYREIAKVAAVMATEQTGFAPTPRLLEGPKGRWKIDGPWERYQTQPVTPDPRAPQATK